MSVLDDTLGASPVSDTQPAGGNPREGATYNGAQEQIDKLTNINASSGVDWVLLADLCARILRLEGKDLNAAVWLLCAWTSNRGADGLVCGVRVLRDMLENYWNELTPAPSRLRARRNQCEWLLEWLDARLGGSFDPIPASHRQRLVDDWDAVDTFWREQDSEGPGFFRLRRRLLELPVLPEVASVVEPVALASEPSAEQGAQAVQQRSASPALTAVTAPNAPVLTVVSFERNESVEKSIGNVFSSLTPLINFCLEEQATLPLLYRLTRQMAWMTIEQAPPAQANITRLPAPAENQLESFVRLQAVGDPLDILRFCEARLGTYPFWLDLNRASHAALSRLGANASAAASSVIQETRQLISRLPVLAELCFADSQPFADAVTRSWLEELQAKGHESVGGLDVIDQFIAEAKQAATEGLLDDALSSLQGQVQQAAAGRDRFRLRRAQCELLHRFDPRAQLTVALDVLLKEAQEIGLQRWEPDLVRPLLEMAVAAGEGGAQSDWNSQLAAIDLSSLWRLSRDTSP
jgi:type VI secretion system protein VasJ